MNSIPEEIKTELRNQITNVLDYVREAYTAEWKKSTNPPRKRIRLLEEQMDHESRFRQQVVRHYIAFSGLTPHAEEIIAGLNQSARGVPIHHDTPAMQSSHPARWRDIFQHDSRSVLEFALDYVDRWKMYSEIFSAENFSITHFPQQHF